MKVFGVRLFLRKKFFIRQRRHTIFCMKEAAYYNGEIGEASEMRVPFLERTNFFGDAVYDVTYAQDYGLFAIGEHTERLFASARRAGIEPPLARCELIDRVRRTARACDSGDLMVYMQFSGGAGRREHVRRTSPSVWIYCLPKSVEDRERKYKLITMPDVRYGLCGIKTINLLPNVLAANAADSVGADECILLTGNTVNECAHSNVSILKDGMLTASPARGQILDGISMRRLIAACAELGIPVSRRTFTLEEVKGADEVIVTSSGVPCTAAERVDGIKVGGRSERLLARLKDMLYGGFELACALDRGEYGK